MHAHDALRPTPQMLTSYSSIGPPLRVSTALHRK
jgi:hypothetical protein